MNLSNNNFFKNTLTKVFKFKDNEWRTPYTRYGYESASTIYLVDIRDSDGDKQYKHNYGFDIEPDRFHRAIENHFSI